jgi:hypothetical protein
MSTAHTALSLARGCHKRVGAPGRDCRGPERSVLTNPVRVSTEQKIFFLLCPEIYPFLRFPASFIAGGNEKNVLKIGRMPTCYSIRCAVPTGSTGKSRCRRKRIRYPGFEPGKKERIITPMENSAHDAGENRVAALEKKVDGVEVLVREFTQELLDLMAITREMSLQAGKHNLREPGPMQGEGHNVPGAFAAGGNALQESCTVMDETTTRQEDTGPLAPEEPVMDMIMQTDGTMKPEPRRGNKNCLVAPTGYGASGGSGRCRKGIQVRPGQSRLT